MAGSAAASAGAGTGSLAEETYKLAREEELRLEVGFSSSVSITLTTGTAEVFGSELPLDNAVTIPGGSKLAVFTFHGATVKVVGEPAVAYVAGDTPNISYLNAHWVLEAQRRLARTGTGRGPRVVLCGPTSSGKSTIARVLLNYAVRCGGQPMLVDLDVGQSMISIPGTLSCVPVTRVITPDEGLPLIAPLVYWFGAATPGDNPELYRAQLRNLVQRLVMRMDAVPEAGASGLIVNTMGWVDGLGQTLLLESIKALEADTVIVLNDDRLYTVLRRALRKDTCVTKLTRSGGVVMRDQAFRRRVRNHRIHTYFYGELDELSPYKGSIRVSDVKLFRVGAGPVAPNSALPIGASRQVDPTRIVQIGAGPDLKHHMVAMMLCSSQEEISSANVAGFVYLTDIDISRPNGRISYLAPCPGALPSKIWMVGSIKWLE